MGCATSTIVRTATLPSAAMTTATARLSRQRHHRRHPQRARAQSRGSGTVSATPVLAATSPTAPMTAATAWPARPARLPSQAAHARSSGLPTATAMFGARGIAIRSRAILTAVTVPRLHRPPSVHRPAQTCSRVVTARLRFWAMASATISTCHFRAIRRLVAMMAATARPPHRLLRVRHRWLRHLLPPSASARSPSLRMACATPSATRRSANTTRAIARDCHRLLQRRAASAMTA